MIAIPEKLLQQFERRNVLLFVGERILYDAEGRVFIDELAKQLASYGGISDAETLAFPALGQLGHTRPEIAPQVIEALRPALADEHIDIRNNATSILVRTWTTQVQETGELTSTLASLVDPLDSQERLLAGRVLFLLALREPWRAKEIRARLQELNRLSDPHLRLAANQTLQMFNLIELAWQAIDHPKKQNGIEAQLRTWQNSKLFGPEVNWAAMEALNYVRQNMEGSN
jgi:hypothetical protein